MSGGHRREFGCLLCGLVEDVRSDAGGYRRLLARWMGVNVLVPPEEALAAVVAEPEADDVRLHYAEAVEADEPARATYIRCAVWRAALYAAWESRSGSVPAPAMRRATEFGIHATALERAHGEAWARPLLPHVLPVPAGPGYAYERGFVAHVRTSPTRYLGPLPTLTPVQHLDLVIETGEERAALPEVLTSPHLASVRTLGLWGAGLTDTEAVAIAAAPHLGSCWWLNLASNRIGEAGMTALAAAPGWRRSLVIVEGNPADPCRQWSGDLGPAAWISPLGEHLLRTHGPIPWVEVPFGGWRISRHQPRRWQHHLATTGGRHPAAG
ncbi:MAG TPA: hypothetical protein VGD67_16740 [Pseudonocardiaceae bacterium]